MSNNKNFSRIFRTFKTDRALRKKIIAALILVNTMAFSNATKPNILFICIDDMRPELLSYGSEFGLLNKVIAPNIEKLAKDSVIFKRAYTSYPVCVASRASMFSGYRIDWNKGNPDRTLPSVNNGTAWPKRLKDAGYWTAGIGKVTHGYNSDDTSESEKWWDVYEGYGTIRRIQISQEVKDNRVATGGRADLAARFETDSTMTASGSLVWQSVNIDDSGLSDGVIADTAINYIRNIILDEDGNEVPEKKRKEGQPFCIFAGFLKPHLPLVAPAKYFDLYNDTMFEVPNPPPGEARRLRAEDSMTKKKINPSPDPDTGTTPPFDPTSIRAFLWNQGMPDEEAKSVIKAYFACISYVDALVGNLLQALEDEGLAQNTIVCLWSDHGFLLGEHGMWQKNHYQHLSQLLALMMKVPQKAPGSAYSIVEVCDIYPTILDLVNVDYQNQQVHGESLVRILDNTDTVLEPNVAAASGGLGYYTLISQQYTMSTHLDIALNHRGNESKQETKLYDIVNDPIEWYNLASLPQYREYIEKSIFQLSELWEIDFEPKWPAISERDSDGNGTLDRDEQIFEPGSNFVLLDTDQDGVPNYLDTDS